MFLGEPLLRAIKIVGSRQEISKVLGISRQNLNSWLNGGIEMGYHYAIVLELLTFGQVTAAELAPKQSQLLKKHKISTSSHVSWLRRQPVPISSIYVPPRPHQMLDEVANLAENIQQEGLLRPMVIDTKNSLVFGERRLRACQLINKNTVPVVVLSLEGLLKDPEAGCQLKKYFMLSELAAIGIVLEVMLGKRQGQRNDLSLRLNLDEVTGRTDQLIANLLQLGKKDSYRQAKKVVQVGIRALINAMDEERISISAAAEIAALPPAEQQQILSGSDQSIMEKVKQIKTNKKLIGKKQFLDCADAINHLRN